jgi:hypothetical protein
VNCVKTAKKGINRDVNVPGAGVAHGAVIFIIDRRRAAT